MSVLKRASDRWFGIVINYDGPCDLGLLWRLGLVVLPVVILPVFIPLGLLTWRLG